jgi:subtilase family serine protease
MGSDAKSLRTHRLTVELLEPRNFLSAARATALPATAAQLVATPMATVISRSASSQTAITNPTIVGYTPSQILAAYGFNQLTSFSTQNGGSEPANGAGQTIAIVDAYNDPNIVSDLAVFDSTFGIAAPPSFKIVGETGTSKLPATNPGWDTEISLDVEWAHAIAPGANILLVETTSDRWSDLITGVDYAKNQSGVSVVSMSWDVPEYRVEAATDSTFTTAANHPVTFVAAAGDYGSPPMYPATSPNVLSVGGTTLILSGSTYVSETAWSDGGGGVSTVEKEPAYQDGAQNSGYRSAPDVAYDADPNTGLAVYDTIDDRYGTGWQEIGGTSAGAPQWAALIAIADEGLAAAGKPALAQAQQRLYSLPANAFHDITRGSNGTYFAGPGYDAVTGLGTPVANVLINDLVNGTTGSPTGVTDLARFDFGLSGGGAGAVIYTVAGQPLIAPTDFAPPQSSGALSPQATAETEQQPANESIDGPAASGELSPPPSAVSRAFLTAGDASETSSTVADTAISSAIPLAASDSDSWDRTALWR